MTSVYVVITFMSVIVIGSLSCIEKSKENIKKKGWVIDFIDEFEFFDDNNWQDQLLWVNEEDQCYVIAGKYKNREVSNGSLKLRLGKLNIEISCSSNVSKFGKYHPKTRYVSGRLVSKNL